MRAYVQRVAGQSRMSAREENVFAASLRFGFLADDSEPGPEAEGGRLRPAPVRYEHFELEVNPSGFPVILGAGAMAITYRARDTHSKRAGRA